MTLIGRNIEGWSLYLQTDLTVLVLVLVLSGSESGERTTDEALLGRLEALDQNFTFPLSAVAVQLSTARAGLTYCPEARAFLTADWPMRGQNSQRCHTRYQVFRDLRGRGFYLTSAGKFGGDFLVYPGQCVNTSLGSLVVVEGDASPCLRLFFR